MMVIGSQDVNAFRGEIVNVCIDFYYYRHIWICIKVDLHFKSSIMSPLISKYYIANASTIDISYQSNSSRHLTLPLD